MQYWGRRRTMVFTVAAFGLAAFLLAFTLLAHNRHNTERAVGRELQAIAVSIAAKIPPQVYGDVFFRGESTNPVLAATSKDPRFKMLQGILRSAAADYSYLKLGKDNVYTFVSPPDGRYNGKLLWGVMLHETPFTGELYTPPPALAPIIAGKRSGYSPVYLSTASNREWISGYAPILLNTRVIGIVEVAREIREVLETARGSVYPVIFISLGIIVISAGAILVILQFARGLQKTNADLTQTLNKLTQSNAVARHLTESSSDIIFALDAEMRVVSMNSAAQWQLGIDAENAIGGDITAALCAPGFNENAEDFFDPELLRRAVKNLRHSGEKVNLTATLTSRLTGEPKQYRIRIERVSQNAELSYIGRAVSLGEMMIASLLDRTRMRFKLNNSLIMTEEMSTFLAGLCRRYMDDQAVATLRIMLREMLLNAIEHGNLEIDFDAKSNALDTESYFNLIDERRRQVPYRSRAVTIVCSIDAQKIAFRIADEGNGFDHRSMIARLEDEINETAHGRGIMMTLREFDEMRYNEKGNAVTLVKYLRVV